MKLEIRWSENARNSFRDVVEQIKDKWTDKEVSAFVKKVDRTLAIISVSPHVYQSTPYEGVHRAVVITKQTSVLYKANGDFVDILFFWDNRQDPML